MLKAAFGCNQLNQITSKVDPSAQATHVTNLVSSWKYSPKMWRCASRGLAGILGALTVHQNPAFAESTFINNALAATLSADKENIHTGCAQPTAGSATSTSTAANDATDVLKQPPSIPRKPQLPRKLEQGTHFAVFDGKTGTASNLSSISAAIQTSDVVFLGEHHDDPVAHVLQLELLRRTAKQLGYRQTKHSSSSTSNRAHGNSDQQQRLDHEQQQVTAQPSRPLILSLEMFERDVQPVLDEYLAGYITVRDLLRDSRPWPNYITDYAPLVDFCKSSAIHVIAANAPRRYVSLTGREGREALTLLPAAAMSFLAPLPYRQPTQQYVDKIQSTMKQAAEEMRMVRQQQQQQQQRSALVESEQHMEQQQSQQDSHKQLHKQQTLNIPGSTGSSSSTDSASQGAAAVTSPTPAAAAAATTYSDVPSGACPYIGFNTSSNFLDAQVLWDATMAHSIAQQLVPAAAAVDGQQQPSFPAAAAAAAETRPIVLHVCGKFHCEQGLGIPEHLPQYAPGTRMLNVVFVPSSSTISQQQGVEGKTDGAGASILEQLGLKGLADYVVLTDASLPRSFDSVHPV